MPRINLRIGECMRLRIVLPLASVVLGVVLFRVGDLQVRRAIAVHGAYEGVQDGVATARYFDYALNAPAWALLGGRGQLWGPSTYWTGYDLRYFLASAAMWFLIGLVADKRGRGQTENPTRKSTWKRLVGWTCLCYGAFTCYAIFPQRGRLPLTAYRVAILNSLGRGWWWYALGLAWGLGLIAVGLYSLFRSKKAMP